MDPRRPGLAAERRPARQRRAERAGDRAGAHRALHGVRDQARRTDRRTASGAVVRHERTGVPPEPFTVDYQHSLVRAIRDRVDRRTRLLQRQLPGLPREVEPLARELLACRDALARQSGRARRDARSRQPHPMPRRLSPGPGALRGRRLHHSRLRGRAGAAARDPETEGLGAVRRLRHAAVVSLRGHGRSTKRSMATRTSRRRWRTGATPGTDGRAPGFCRRIWKRRANVANRPCSCRSHHELRALLRLHLIDKCSYELSYELNNRPAWVSVPDNRTARPRARSLSRQPQSGTRFTVEQ